MSWDSPLILLLYGLWIICALLVVKLLVTRRRWRHPLRGNGPMLFGLLLVLVNTEVSRARNINIGIKSPPPYLPSVFIVCIATLFILYWLWRQLELIPAWIRTHLPWLRKRSDYTVEEHDRHAHERR